MNINVYIEDELNIQLQTASSALHKTRNAIIREAISEWLQHHKAHEWPLCVQNFKGTADAPRFESYRDELKKPKEDPLK